MINKPSLKKHKHQRNL